MTKYESSNRVASTSNPLVQMLLVMTKYRNLWLVPLVVGTIGAVAYAYLAPKKYEARQTLVIRDDLMGDAYKPGRFDSQESLKSAQETVLEVARRPKVIRSVMKRLGPADGRPRDNWPDDDTIESMQGVIGVRAPNGEELGKTETISLVVKAESRERAAAFVTYLLEEIEREWNAVRRARFQSMASELRQAADGARAEFEAAAARLQAMEQKVGADLADLRGLNDAQTGSNGLRQTLTEVKAELREAKRKYESTRLQRQILLDAYSDPEYSATPVELLDAQPELAYLKQGLNEARLRLASDLGRFNESHPVVASDRAAIADLKKQIHDHLKAALEGVDAQLKERQRHLARLEQTVEEYTQRLDRLSAMRVEYEKLVQDYDNKLAVFRDLQENLTRVESLASPETHVSLLTPIDEPQVSANPVGPSKKIIVLGGAVASLIFGIGLVLLFAPLDIVELAEPPSKHRNDVGAATAVASEPVGEAAISEPPVSEPPQATEAPSQDESVVPGQSQIDEVVDQNSVALPGDDRALHADDNKVPPDGEPTNAQADDNSEWSDSSQADDANQAEAVAPPSSPLPIAPGVVVTAGPESTFEDVVWATVVQTDHTTLDQASMFAKGLDTESLSSHADPTEGQVEGAPGTADGCSLNELTDDVVLSLSEELDSLISEPCWEIDSDQSPNSEAAESGTVLESNEIDESGADTDEQSSTFVQADAEADVVTSKSDSDIKEPSPVPPAKSSAEQLLAAVPSFAPVDLADETARGGDGDEFPVESLEAELAESFCQDDSDDTEDEATENVASAAPVEAAEKDGASLVTNDDLLARPEQIVADTTGGVPNIVSPDVASSNANEAEVGQQPAESELDPWVDRGPKPERPGSGPETDRRDDDEKTAAARKVRPLRISELREQLEYLKSCDEEPSEPDDASTEIEDGPTSIDQQIERLSDSLLKFCQSIQQPVDDDTPPSPPSPPPTSGPSSVHRAE